MDLFNDPEFEKYRALEIEEGISFLRSVDSDASSDYFKGAMAMLKRIVKLPIKMIPPENISQKEQAKTLINRAYAVFETKMIKHYVVEDRE